MPSRTKQHHRLSAALTLAALVGAGTTLPAEAAGVLTVEDAKEGVIFGTYPGSGYEQYQVITEGDMSYDAVDLSKAKGKNLENFAQTVTITGAGGQVIKGTDRADIVSFGGGILNIGAESGARTALKANSLETRSSGKANLVNLDATLTERFTADADATVKNSTVTTRVTEAGGTFTLENATLNTQYFLGGDADEITLKKSTINAAVHTETITDDDGNKHEVFNYRVTDIQESDYSSMTLEDSTVDLGLTDGWMGTITLKSTEEKLHGSFALLAVSHTDNSGYVMTGSGFGDDANFHVGDNTTLAITHLSYTKNEQYRVGNSWRRYPVEAKYADAATVKARIAETLATLDSKPSAILYLSTPLRYQNFNGNQITVGSDAVAEDGAITFGSKSLLIVDRSVDGSFWQLEGQEAEPVISILPSTTASTAAATVRVNAAEGAQVFIKGLEDDLENIKLVGDGVEIDRLWDAASIKTDNPLYGFKFSEDGKTIIAQIQTPSSIFGDRMMAAEIMETAYLTKEADRNETEKYLVDVLNAMGNERSFTTFSEEELTAVGKKTDLVLNPAGAAAVYSTAFDSADEMIQTVEKHMGSAKSADQQAWAAILGGKTKIDELSTAMAAAAGTRKDTVQSVKRDSYGIAVGYDTPIAPGVRVGLSGGFTSGETKNDFVGVKDKFDAWTLMGYARYAMGPVTLDGHVGATLLRSEVTNGINSRKTNLNTWVYNAGARASVGVLLGETIVYPFVGAELFHLKGENYDSGPGLAVSTGATSSTLMVPVGFTWEGAYKTRWGVAAPSLGFTWARVFGDRSVGSSLDALNNSVDYDFTFADRTLMRVDLGLSLKGDNYDYGLYGSYLEGSEDREAYKLSTSAAYHF